MDRPKAGSGMEDSVCGNRVWCGVTPSLPLVDKSPIAKAYKSAETLKTSP